MSARDDYHHAYDNKGRTGALGAQDIEAMCYEIDRLRDKVADFEAERLLNTGPIPITEVADPPDNRV